MPELDNKDCKLLLAKIEDELYPHLALGYALTAARKYPKPPKNGNYIWWSEFQRMGKKRNLPLPKNYGRAEDGASILYSGGTTGTTKGILLSNMNFNALGLQTIAASGFSPIDGMKMLSVMPVFHGFGLGIGIHTALIGGACCILVPKFNVNTCLLYTSISPHATRSSACGLSAASRHPIGRAEPCVGPLPSMPTTASQMHSRGLQYSHRSTIMFAKSSIFGYL